MDVFPLVGIQTCFALWLITGVVATNHSPKQVGLNVKVESTMMEESMGFRSL